MMIAIVMQNTDKMSLNIHGGESKGSHLFCERERIYLQLEISIGLRVSFISKSTIFVYSN